MLVRLRANPETVRVSIRRWGPPGRDHWCAWIETKTPPQKMYFAQDDDPEVAVTKALEIAYEDGASGVDPHCEWSYHHPQHPKSEVA